MWRIVTLFFNMASYNISVDDGEFQLVSDIDLSLLGSNCTIGSSDPNCILTTMVPPLKRVYHGEIWTPEVIQRIVTLAVIMTLTLLGNVIIIIVLTCSKYRKLNSRVNIFIINLAIGDLTVCCFTMTTEVLFVVFENAWVMGAIACKILLYVQIITLASTTFILVAMSYDRYLALCRPLSLGTNMKRARKMIAIAWIMALVFASPQLLIFKQVADGIYPDGEIKYKCKSAGYTAWWQRKLYFTFMMIYILIIPTIIICFCYINVVRVVWQQGKEVTGEKEGVSLRRTVGKDSKSIPRAKIKTIKMTLSIICSFICCWTPYFVVHLIHIWSEYQYTIPEPVYVFAETIALLNSALNPILYGCFNIKLKRGLFEVFCPQKLSQREKTRTFNRSMNEFVALADSGCTSAAKRFSTKCIREASSSGGSEGKDNKNAPRDSFITEENVNGVKLRVRFISEKQNGNPEGDALLHKEEMDGTQTPLVWSKAPNWKHLTISMQTSIKERA